MKPCEEYIDLIQRGVDGELSDAERDQLETHLAACPGCKALYDAYENIQAGILEGEEEPPKELSEAVMRSIRREKEEKKPLYMFKRWKFTLIAAAAVLVIFIAGKYVNLDFGSADTTESAAAEAAVEEMDAAPAAGAAAEEGAAFQAAPETAETEEEADVEEAAEEAEEPGEAPMPESEGTDTTESQAARYTLDDAWAGLHADGYSGDLYQLTMTEEEFLALLPDCEKIQLSSGPVVYRSSMEDFRSVQTELRSNRSIAADTESEDVFYWLAS